MLLGARFCNDRGVTPDSCVLVGEWIGAGVDGVGVDVISAGDAVHCGADERVGGKVAGEWGQVIAVKMEVLKRQVWVNFLSLLPSTILTVLIISIAFLRFYDERDFEFLGFVAHPRVWSNRFTVAAFVAALANFGVEWNRRNRETDRLAREEDFRAREEQRRVREKQRRVREEQRRVREEQRRVREENFRAEEEQHRAEAREQAARRARIEARCRIAQIKFQLEPNEAHRRELMDVLAVLEEYGNTF